ncbi:MAG: hypothetical protein CMQ20_08015 [Gammaproteobacteria bacterium]|jgi:uncharacterized membrane protein|nr:hypothetical protein [Gammaproteobacteria bacterium]|tara:strand:+ start:172 stop:657 length:486 start_codon:yes stop_codon:yes gene_type:complete
MQDYEGYVLARVLHVFGVILWIGGVAFVTTVLIPSLRRIDDLDSRIELFEKLEGRFGVQAKVTTLVAGISGFYMVIFNDAWELYLQLQFWWLHLMTLVWLIFTLVLFVLEPLFLHQWFRDMAAENSDMAFRRLHGMHIVLLGLSLLAVLGAVAGSHGILFF